MLAFLGLSTLDELFAVVPEAVKLQRDLELADGVGEPDVLDRMEGFADRNRARTDRLVCFAGGGAYDHEIPSVTRALAGRVRVRDLVHALPARGGPGRAAGRLRVPDHGGPDRRAAGGQRLAVRRGQCRRRGRQPGRGRHRPPDRLGVRGDPPPLAPDARHLRRRDRAPDPHRPPGRRRHRLARRRRSTTSHPAWSWWATRTTSAASRTSAAVRALCDRTGALMVVGADPLAAGLLRSAGDWGADVMVGEGQVFGTALGFGGPYLGLFACSSAHVRRLPGRLVGETVDVEGRTAYVTTLRAREQDIRREKATSNVCTNQTLMAVTAAIQLGWLGTSGLVEVATRCARATRYARDAVLAVDGVTPWADAPVLREFAVRLPRPGRQRDRAHGRRRLPGRDLPRGRGRPTATTVSSSPSPNGGRPPRSTPTPPPWPRRWPDGRGDDVTTTTAAPRAARPRSAPLLGRDAEPTLFELSHPGRRAWSFRTTGDPRGAGRGPGARRPPPRRRRWTWPRCPSATWSPTSPACPTGSSPSTWAPTRSGRAP